MYGKPHKKRCTKGRRKCSGCVDGGKGARNRAGAPAVEREVRRHHRRKLKRRATSSDSSDSSDSDTSDSDARDSDTSGRSASGRSSTGRISGGRSSRSSESGGEGEGGAGESSDDDGRAPAEGEDRVAARTAWRLSVAREAQLQPSEEGGSDALIPTSSQADLLGDWGDDWLAEAAAEARAEAAAEVPPAAEASPLSESATKAPRKRPLIQTELECKVLRVERSTFAPTAQKATAQLPLDAFSFGPPRDVGATEPAAAAQEALEPATEPATEPAAEAQEPLVAVKVEGAAPLAATATLQLPDVFPAPPMDLTDEQRRAYASAVLARAADSAPQVTLDVWDQFSKGRSIKELAKQRGQRKTRAFETAAWAAD